MTCVTGVVSDGWRLTSSGRSGVRGWVGRTWRSALADLPGCPYTGTMPPLLAIGSEPVSLDLLVAAVTERAGDATGSDGAVVTFLGLVRNRNLGRRVLF